MNKTFLILAFILLIIYCLNNKKESKNKKQVGGFYNYFLVYYLMALEDEYINTKPSSMYHLMNNLPPMEQKSIVFFNTIKVLIEGNVNVKGSRFIGNNKKEKINKISSNLKYIKSHINLVNEVYTLKRDRKGLDYYEHKETLERINTYPFIKLENNTILKFQTGENLKDYIIALKNEYIEQIPKSMLRYLSLYPNLNNNTLNSFNHIKLLIESSNNKKATTSSIINMIQDNKGIEIRDMVLRKLAKWSMKSSDFPGYMTEVIRTEKKPLNIKKIEKYMSRKDIVNKLENKETTVVDTPDEVEASQYEPTEAPQYSESTKLSEPKTAPSPETTVVDTPDEAEVPQYSESIKPSEPKTASSSEIDFEKQYYILKEQNEELEGNYDQLEGSYQKLERDFEESSEENDSLEKDLYNTRQQLKKNRGKLDSFRIMEDFDKDRDGIISRLEIEDKFTENTQKKGGSLDKYYKLL